MAPQDHYAPVASSFGERRSLAGEPNPGSTTSAHNALRGADEDPLPRQRCRLAPHFEQTNFVLKKLPQAFPHWKARRVRRSLLLELHPCAKHQQGKRGGPKIYFPDSCFLGHRLIVLPNIAVGMRRKCGRILHNGKELSLLPNWFFEWEFP